nr:hypothetical protein [Tanacetum cinerariifolium]
MTLPVVPNFPSIFQFDQRVSALETKVSGFNQTSQFVEAISSILGFFDNYLVSKLKEEVNVAVQLQSNKLKEESEAENQKFINQVDSTTKKIIKERVKVQTSYVVAASLLEFELKKILIDKMDTNELTNRSDIQRNIYNALVESYNTDKDIFSIYGNVVTFKKGRDDQTRSDRGTKRREYTQAEEPEFEAADTKMQQDQGNESGHIDDQPDNEAAPKHDWFQKPNKPRTHDRAWNKSKSVNFRPVKVMRWYDYGYLEEIVIQIDDNVLYKFKEGNFPRLNVYDIEDMLLLLVQKKLSNLDIDDRYDLGVALRMFTRCMVILHRVEDLQLGVESY